MVRPPFFSDSLVSFGDDTWCGADRKVFFDSHGIGIDLDAITARLRTLSPPITVMRSRLVMHHQTDPRAVEEFIEEVKNMRREVEAGKGDKLKAAGERLPEEVKAEKASDLRRHAALGYR
jgi:threonine aldolase